MPESLTITLSDLEKLETAQCLHANATRIVRIGEDFYINFILLDPWSIHLEMKKAKANSKESSPASIPGKVLVNVNMSLGTFLNLKNQVEEIFNKLPEGLKSGKLKNGE